MKKVLYIFVFLFTSFVYSQTATENYVKSTTYQVATQDGNVTNDEKIESITYYDGLNRPKQSIALRAGGNKEDLITPVFYDQFGRQSKNYLPLPKENNNGDYYPGNTGVSLTREIKDYYKAKFPDDFYQGGGLGSIPDWDNPFSESIFEDSPLNRVIETSAPGYDWRSTFGEEHTIKNSVETNSKSEVRLYKVIYIDGSPTLDRNGYYNENDLIKNIVKDENWVSGKLNTVETFTDKSGKTLLTNNYVLENGSVVKLSTYFVYDDIGRLIYKLSPEAAKNSYEDFNQSWPTQDFLEPGNTTIEGEIIINVEDDTLNLLGDFQLTGISPATLQPTTVKTINSIVQLPDMFLTQLIGHINGTSFHVGDILIINGDFVINRVSSNQFEGLSFSFSERYIDDASYGYFNESWDISNLLENSNGFLIGNLMFDIQNNTINISHDFSQSGPGNSTLKLQTIKDLTTSHELPDMFLTELIGFPQSGSSFVVGTIKILNGKLVIDRVTTNPFYYLTFNPNPIQIELENFEDSFELNKLSFQYKYDDFNRIVEQKTPDKGWEYLIYDKLDRPILTQDANLRAQNKWLFTKYDVFGRVAYTGLYSTSKSLETLKSEAIGLPLNEERETNSVSIGDTNLYYSNNTYPTQNIEVLTINYYDTYIDYTGIALPTSVFGESTQVNTKGLPTVSRVRVLDTSDWIVSLTGYNEDGNIIYATTKNNYLLSLDVIKNKVDFVGKVLESETKHTKTGNANITTRDYYSYDHLGRVLTHQQRINNEPTQLITNNNYDELGQLVIKKVGGELFKSGYTNLMNVNVNASGLITKTNAYNVWNANLSTIGEIESDGGLSWKVPHENKYMKIGLGDTNSISGSIELDFYIYFRKNSSNNAIFTGYARNLQTGNLQILFTDTYETNDNFAIEWFNDDILYLKNGKVVYTHTPTQLPNTLVGNLSFKTPSSSISDLHFYASGTINKSLQTVNYKFNVRGWLTHVNDVNFSQKSTDLFNYKIIYNKAIEGSAGNPGKAVPLFNGNIAQTIWRTKNSDSQKRGYGYKYDALNRIKVAYSRKGNALNTLDYHSIWGITYDRNGNIQKVSRNGYNESSGPALWDDLSYNYEGNQLIGVVDNSTSTQKQKGFNDANNSNQDYAYNDNGNIISDANKYITNISYNHLDLPTYININNKGIGGIIQYIYDATGAKLKKIVTPHGINPIPIVTEYNGNYVYQKIDDGENILQFFSHPEGYIEPTPVIPPGGGTTKSVKGIDTDTGQITYSAYNYVFQYRDHLGNVRLSYSDLDKNGAIATSEIIEDSHFYPFGLKHQGYNSGITGGGNAIAQQWKFGGKQLQEDFNLGWYDFGSRNYDAALGRWFNTDPQNQFASPYLYGFNNPIASVDPDGELAWIIVAAAVGGVINLASNAIQGNINNLGDGLAAFSSGAAAGALATFGPAGWAAGGAIVGGTNAYLSGAETFGDIAQGTIVGAVSGLAGGAAGQWASNSLGNAVINGLNVTSPIAKGVIGGAIGGGVGGYAGGFTGGLLMTGDIGDANNAGLSGLATGVGIGATVGGVSGYASAKANGVNPWTGVKENSVAIGGPQSKVNAFAKDFGTETITDNKSFGTWPDEFGNGYLGRNIANPDALKFNQNFMRNVIDSKTHIYDFQRNGYSPFYNGIEQSMIRIHNYQYNVTPVRTTSFFNYRFRVSWF